MTLYKLDSVKSAYILDVLCEWDISYFLFE